jgi:hypothetical protein
LVNFFRENADFERKKLLEVITVDESSVRGLFCNAAKSPELCQRLAMPKCNDEAKSVAKNTYFKTYF